MSSIANSAIRGLARPGSRSLVRRAAAEATVPRRGVFALAASAASSSNPAFPLVGAPDIDRRPTGIVSVRRLSRKGSKMGHHLETLDEMAHREAHAEATERRKKKKAHKKGERGKRGEDEFEGAAAAAASGMEDVSLDLAEDAGEAKFDSSSDEVPSLPDKADVKARMMKVVDAMEESFRAIRGAEPTPELFEHIQVRAYGTSTPLSSVAQVVISGPNRATLTCYDPETANAVRDAVRDAGMNFNPQIEEGGVVVVPIPKVSMETRQAVVKQLRKAAEAGRQRVRRVRRAAQDVVKKGKDGKLEGISKDDAFRVGKDIDAVTEEAIAALNTVVEKKQQSVMAV